MTSPPVQPRTGNEQRIASLEAEVVTMRGALETSEIEILAVVDDLLPQLGWKQDFPTAENKAIKEIRSALSSSTDYANKIVVDRALLHTAYAMLRKTFDSLPAGAYIHGYSDMCARLDSLRQGGGG